FALASRPRWPGLRDMGAIALGVAAMVGALWPMRSWAPGVVTLTTQIIVGAGVFGALALVLNIAGLRAPVVARIRALANRGRNGAEAVGEG
ncbi:MAG: hypothetical protein KDJ30_07380, partial [Rhodoblastus sp.]|nr:hypothetical protein [Rhodoblastus sp.]